MILMKPFYKVLLKPKDRVELKIDEDFKKKLEKNKPWFLILNKNSLEKNFIEFIDKKAGANAKIDSQGLVEYQELILLEKEIDITRTIAVVCGMLKLGKIIYFDQKTSFMFLFEIKNIKNREVMRSESLSIYGEVLSKKDNVSVEKSINFDKNFDAYQIVNEIMVEVREQIDCPIDEVILKREIKNAIDVLDNPMLFALKTNQQ
jgi:hypothetical protein